MVTVADTTATMGTPPGILLTIPRDTDQEVALHTTGANIVTEDNGVLHRLIGVLLDHTGGSLDLSGGSLDLSGDPLLTLVSFRLAIKTGCLQQTLAQQMEEFRAGVSHSRLHPSHYQLTLKRKASSGEFSSSTTPQPSPKAFPSPPTTYSSPTPTDSQALLSTSLPLEKQQRKSPTALW